MNFDITSKLEFTTNPTITIGGESYELNADAGTMLKIMAISETPTAPNMAKAGLLLLGEDGNAKLLAQEFDTPDGKKKLNFKDYGAIIAACITIAAGNDPNTEDNSKN